MSTPAIVSVANYHCLIGENPLWNERDGRIYWEDIDTGRLFRASHETLEHECFYQGEVIGGFTFQADGKLLLFEADRIVELNVETGHRKVMLEHIDPDMERFNDVIADPEGRVYAGSIGRTKQSGGLYRLDPDGSIRVVWKGTGCSNGMGFTGDLRLFYWTCSTTSTIFVANYDRATGELTDRRPYYVAPASEGTPDGIAMDVADHLWTARWGGHTALRMSPDARILERIEFPVARVSSLAFGGPALDTLYVTTAGGTPDGTGPEGTLYRVQVKTPGRLEYRSRIWL